MQSKPFTGVCKVALCITFQFLSFFGFSQTTYYVAVNGDNDNDGLTAATPWKTIQKACSSATANSTVLIRGGTYVENVTVTVKGNAGQPITFRNYPNETVILDGTGTAGSAMLTINNKSYLKFEGITIQNLTRNNAKGILVQRLDTGTENVTSLTFRKLIIKNIRWTTSTTRLPTENNNAQPFIAYGRGETPQQAITGLVIDSCEFLNNIPGYSEVLSVDGNIDGFTISNNRVHDNINIGIYAGGNYGECSVPALDHARNGVIEKNICYRNVARYATSGGIYADGAHDVIIRGNTSYENGYGIDVGCEMDGTTERITVIDNLVYNNQDAGITVGGYDTLTSGQVLNSLIRNNTLFRNDSQQNGSGEFYITKASNCVFKNNVVFTGTENTLLSMEEMIEGDGTPSPQNGNIFNYNVYHTPTGNISNTIINWKGTPYNYSGYKTNTSQDLNSAFALPNFVNATLPSPDLHVQSGSPCRDAGDPATVILPGETDFDGQVRVFNGRIDIGAFEASSALVTPSGTGIAMIKISAFPNPAQGQLTVQTDSPNKIIVLTDSYGEVQLTERLDEPETKLDVNNLPNGVYYLKITDGSAPKVVRVLIAHD